MRDTGRAPLENGQVGVVKPDAVRGDRSAAEDTPRIQNAGRRLLQFRQSVVALLFGFGHVDQKRRVVLVGQSAAGAQRLFGVGIQRVRRDGGNDQRIVAEALEEPFGEFQRIGGSLVIRGREADDGFADHAAHPGLFSGLGDNVLEVVHIGVRGRAAEQHFEAGQSRAPADEIGRDVLLLGGENVFLEPILQTQIVGDSAEQRHRRVAVGVDEAGRDEIVGPVDTLFRLKALFDLRPDAHAHYAIAADRDGAVLDEPPLRVHGDDVAGGDDVVRRLRGGGKRQKQDHRRDAEDAEFSEKLLCVLCVSAVNLKGTKHRTASETDLSA